MEMSRRKRRRLAGEFPIDFLKSTVKLANLVYGKKSEYPRLITISQQKHENIMK